VKKKESKTQSEILPPIESKTQPEILPPVKSKLPTLKKTFKKVKDPVIKSLPSEFVNQLRFSNFRGIWIFGSEKDFLDWMEVHAETLDRDYRGNFSVDQRGWIFPWGATLRLKVLNRPEDLEVFRGQRYDYIGVTGKIDPKIQEIVVDFIALSLRKKIVSSC